MSSRGFNTEIFHQQITWRQTWWAFWKDKTEALLKEQFFWPTTKHNVSHLCRDAIIVKKPWEQSKIRVCTRLCLSQVLPRKIF